VPKIHELERLRTVLQPHYPSLRLRHRGLAFLTNFAVGVRYPGDNATKRQADAALRWAGRVREARAARSSACARRAGGAGSPHEMVWKPGLEPRGAAYSDPITTRA
jgi:hypothetical protein